WSGLVHLGLNLPQVTESLHDGHGPMMILGFLGTLITMERAVALGERWAFLGPAFSAAGGLAVLLGLPLHAGPVLLTAGGVVWAAVAVYGGGGRVVSWWGGLGLAAAGSRGGGGGRGGAGGGGGVGGGGGGGGGWRGGWGVEGFVSGLEAF